MEHFGFEKECRTVLANNVHGPSMMLLLLDALCKSNVGNRVVFFSIKSNHGLLSVRGVL